MVATNGANVTVTANPSVTANGGGTAICADNSTVTANGAVTAAGPGIIANNGARVTASNGVSSGFGGTVAATNGSSVTLAGTITTGGGSTELSASSGSTITVNGATLQNNGGAGAMVANAATIIANNITMIWPNGFGAALVQATNGGLIQLSNASISIPSGSSSAVLLADGTGSRIIAADFLALQIGTTGTRGLGLGNGNSAIKAQNGGTIEIPDGGNVSMLVGGGNTGLLATGAGSSITANNLSMTIGRGGGDAGALATAGGLVTLNGGTVTIPGGGGGGEAGLAAIGANSLVNATSVTVNVSGAGGDAGVNAQTGGTIVTSGGSVSVVNGAGGLLQNGGSVTMAGTNVTASGNGGYGFLFNSGGTNTLNYANATIVAGAASFSVQGATANINLAGTTAIANNNTLLETSGTTAFNAQGSTLGGVISTQSGTSTVNLTQGTRWRMTGNSNATNLINDNSTITFTPPSGDPTQLSNYMTLTATNYTGASGRIGLNTFLGADGSPSDRLVINGDTASGTSLLRISNTTGPGAETTGNGIQVVQVLNGGTTATNAFALAGEARGGAFDYFLFRGGPVAGADPNDWFLRSDFTIPPDGGGNGGGGGGDGGVLPPDPPPTILPPGTYPIIGPELATYGSVQPMARQIGLATLGTLNQRIGDTMTLLNAGTDPNGWGRSDWARVFGQQINGRYRAFADPRTDGWLAGFQGGSDLWRGSTIPGHRDSVGLSFAYSQASAEVNGLVTNPAATGYMLTHTGTNDIEAYSAGGYWTHYGPTGWYLDAILQGTLYRGNATTQFAQLPLKGTGFVASLEAGYPIPLPLGPGFVLEPQAQIIWQRVSFDDADDGLGPVGLGTTSGPIGRLGLRGEWNIVSSNGIRWQPYAGFNYWRSWGAEATTTFGGDRVQLLQKMQTVETFAGFTGKLDKSYSVYAQVGYQFDVGNTVNAGPRGAKGTAGIRYSW